MYTQREDRQARTDSQTERRKEITRYGKSLPKVSCRDGTNKGSKGTGSLLLQVLLEFSSLRAEKAKDASYGRVTRLSAIG